MQQKRVVATENFMQPEVLESRLEKFNNRDFESYEYVFYTNRCKGWNEDAETSVVKGHVKGTNQYLFEFPGSWRTKSGGELIIAIRSLQLKTVARQLRLSLNVNLRDEETTYRHLINLYYTSTDTSYFLLQRLNDQWQTQFVDNPTLRDYLWNRVNDTMFVLRETGDILFFNVTFEWVTMSDDMNPDCFSSGYVVPSGSANPTLFIRPSLSLKWDRTQGLLLTADFITQAENQHLGYTGYDFYPLKQYEIKKNTPYFTISLFEENNLRPIELPEDGKDYVVIEAVISRKYEV
jgi:hypothetical protein